MKLVLTAAIATTFLLGADLNTPAAPRTPRAQTPKGKTGNNGSAMTGCVDEQDGKYVLVDDRDLKPVADLVADGFPTEGFAKHMGHKVTVRGTSNPGGTRPVFKVRTIVPVSETCAPQK